MRMRTRLWVAAPLVAAGIPFAVVSATGNSNAYGTTNRVLENAIAVELGSAQPTAHQAQVSGGVVYAALDFSGVLDQRAAAAATMGKGAPKVGKTKTAGCSNTFSGGGAQNVRVNQDCSLRRQAEEVIAIDPTNNKHLIAGQNDSRLGFNKCGYDWSFDGGKTWGDMVPPFYQRLNPDGVTYDACSDPTATFDADGNAYIAGVFFELNLADSGLLVLKSNADAGGTFYHNPGTGAFQEYLVSSPGVVAENNDPNILNDKEFIVADASKTSPKMNNVYVTWTRFDLATGAGVGSHSPIYFSQSTGGGATWSPGIEISGANAAVCTVLSGEANPNACDQDQGSHPIVGKDGTIYVAFGNGNMPTLGLNQHLIVSCAPGADCSNAANWSTPHKIGDDYGMQPTGPDPATGCPAGRQCLPPNGYRMDDFVEGSIAVADNGNLFAAWADFRNGVGSSCDWNGGTAGQAALATPPCNNDVFYAYSTDGGATWSTTRLVTPAARFGQTAQWMPWGAVAPDGSAYYVSFYDRGYGSCETTGCNDITMATIKNPTSATPALTYRRLTTSSMPNLIPSNNPAQAGFIGDYMWVATDSSGKPWSIWADTRGRGGTIEEDIYSARSPAR
jgi:hypothetical protein